MDLFNKHYMDSRIFFRVISESIKAKYSDYIANDSAIYLQGECKLIFIEYFLTIRRKYTDNYYIYRKNEFVKQNPLCSVNTVDIVYDFEHKRFNNSFNSDSLCKYTVYYWQDYFQLLGITKIGIEKELKIIVDERLKHNYSNIIEQYGAEDLIKEISSSLENKQISFILGAGISLKHGIPSWNKLLESSYNYLLSEFDGHTIKTVRKRLGDFLRQAQVLCNLFNDNYSDKLKSLLYKNLKDSSSMQPLVNFITSHNSCVNHIITYNYDDLLEKEIMKTTCINKDEIINKIDHVHGFISRDGKVKTRVILTEKDYFELISVEDKNANQIVCIKNDIVFLIGHSFTDLNLKRLIAINSSKESQIYFFTRFESRKGLSNESQELLKYLEEVYYKEFNVRVVWLEKWAHINSLLNYFTQEI